MSKLNVLVVGASIAGPMTAYWLAKAGCRVTVIERFPSLRTNGQNIDIRTAGVTVMRKIPGMEAAVRAAKLDMEGISFVQPDGRPWGTLRATGNPDQQSLVSEYEIFRGDLARVICDLTAQNENVKYVFNEQVASIRQDEKIPDGPVTVDFANGHLPTSTYDLVVACDGATSRTRAIGLGEGVRDSIHPTNFWAAYFSVPKDLLDGGRVSKGQSLVGGRFIGVGPSMTPGKSVVAMISSQPEATHASTQPFRDAVKQGDQPLKEFVAKRFGGAGGWKMDEILSLMMQSLDFYASEVVQVKTPRLSSASGRFTMVGDAGYAAGFTGGGTTLAIAGAYVLAGEILTHNGDLKAGLKAYEERMRPLIADMQKAPPFLPAALAPQTSWGLWIRNHIFAFITWTRVLEVAQKYLSGAFAEADKYGLPEYEWVA